MKKLTYKEYINRTKRLLIVITTNVVIFLLLFYILIIVLFVQKANLRTEIYNLQQNYSVTLNCSTNGNNFSLNYSSSTPLVFTHSLQGSMVNLYFNLSKANFQDLAHLIDQNKDNCGVVP